MKPKYCENSLKLRASPGAGKMPTKKSALINDLFKKLGVTDPELVTQDYLKWLSIV
jgi:hypothetical protein